MKTIYLKLLFFLLLVPSVLVAQNSVEGTVIDANTKMPISGVNIVNKSGSGSVSTDASGRFKLSNVKTNDKLNVTFVGYQPELITYYNQKSLIISLSTASSQLDAVVVQVGYGSVKKKDATGSLAVVGSKDFNKGAIMSADQLLIGKTPGVRITSSGGQPDADPNIRIRGGASLSGENRPLIVIDNVPIDNQNAAGNSNPLSLINPNDIDTFTILKDASATAIYGARASNGVILITTKRGTNGKPQFNFSTTTAIGNVGKYVNVMSGERFADYITANYPTLVSKLGAIYDPTDLSKRELHSTDWQRVIYRTTYSQDYSFSARANILKVLPIRASVGYNKMEGLVKTNDLERYTGSLKLTPTLFNKSLKIDLNAKGILSKKNDIDGGSIIGSAINMDPTKPVYGYSPDNRFVGYYQDFILDSNQYKKQGSTNPLALINQVRKPQEVKKFVGNIELDYKLPFFPDLRAVTNLGLEASSSKLSTIFAENALDAYDFNKDPLNPIASNPSANYVFNPGLAYKEFQTITNRTFDFYLMYSKKWTKIITKFDAQLGHSYQKFVNNGHKNTFKNDNLTGLRYEDLDPNTLIANRYYLPLVMESYFGRSNVDLYNKYLFTFTVRADASSLFPKNTRWGYFPAAGFAWKMKEEKFLENSKTINDLKLRLGYGITGNSDIRGVAGYFPYLPLFEYGQSTSQYLPGVNSYNALAYNPNLKWETTTTYNAGIDVELFDKGMITASLDVYYRKTKDLLSKVSLPPGQLLTNEFISNIGSMSNKGIEAQATARIIETKKLSWSINGNIAYNIGKIDDLKGIDKAPDTGSGLPNGTGANLAYNKVGEQPYSAWVFEQVYDNAGKPIANVFVDRNKDGKIDDNDRYYVALRPNWTYGFGTTLSVGKFDLTASFRGQLGGKVYDALTAKSGWADRVIPQNSNALLNVLDIDFPFKNVNGNISYSDYFLKSATFLRCESVSLSYKIDGFYKKASCRVFVGVNNLFLATKYKGQDPENFNAIDNNFYPRPRVFNLGANFDF